MEILYQAVVLVILYGRITAAMWCVVRSEASREALQAALDYACGAGADCAPIQQNGLCFLPNTIQAHASYAFNSYYMRRSMAAGSCDFAGTATIAKTDPSYGSCVYPASPSSLQEEVYLHPEEKPVQQSILLFQPLHHHRHPPPYRFLGVAEGLIRLARYPHWLSGQMLNL
ncbi:hypothetical protein Lser_V15G02766 [Lactuca serriola]